MAYLPHAVWAASGRLHGVIETCHLVRRVATGENAGDRLRIYLDLQLVGIPGTRRLFRIRYYGPYTFGGTTAEGSYDDVLDAAYNAASGTDAERWATVTEQIQQQLEGRLVVPINVGGRWIVR